MSPGDRALALAGMTTEEREAARKARKAPQRAAGDPLEKKTQKVKAAARNARKEVTEKAHAERQVRRQRRPSVSGQIQRQLAYVLFDFDAGDDERLLSLEFGQQVCVTGYHEGWCWAVDEDGSAGFCPVTHLAYTNEDTEATKAEMEESEQDSLFNLQRVDTDMTSFTVDDAPGESDDALLQRVDTNMSLALDDNSNDEVEPREGLLLHRVNTDLSEFSADSSDSESELSGQSIATDLSEF